ncbi:MAG: hypothetical protein HYT82_02125 [Candidatus Harrisonbacteria bacterium]|nr:hypothetical protein [Candidatus Harrisonbacteria bacterium]
MPEIFEQEKNRGVLDVETAQKEEQEKLGGFLPEVRDTLGWAVAGALGLITSLFETSSSRRKEPEQREKERRRENENS